jgi:hypothetical protein
MIVELNTDFSEVEKSLLKGYKDVDIKLFIDTDHLFHDGVVEGKVYQIKAENPNRMITVDMYCLLEEKDELGTWNMGQRENDCKYVFWGNYGDLATTLKAR